MLRSCTAVILLLVCSAGLVLGQVVKSGSGYSGIRVAIHKSVPENPALIEKIKSQFKDASRLLYDATGSWAYFKDITIVVPNTWKTLSGVRNIYNDPYKQAEFRIEKANGAFGEVPYTIQPGGCGQPGEYVHLTPEFIMKDDAYVDSVYGPRDRIIIHEWSHLRYGIFDEYGIPGDTTFPLFYFEDGLMKVNLCSGDIKGWIESNDGPICTVHNDTVTKDCIFVPDMSDYGTRATFMSVHYLPSVDRYCTRDGRLGTEHNWQAPNKQNLLCQRRSAWEVVSSHPDFATPTEEPFKDPIFNVVRVEYMIPRYVLVLDVSGSMQGRPLELLKESSQWFVNDFIKDGSYLGVVKFHSFASTVHSVVPVNRNTRGAISSTIGRLVDESATSIGSGILQGIEALKSAGLATEDAVVMVITDGGENTEPMYYKDTVLKAVTASKIKIVSVAYGHAADLGLGKLAEMTKGLSLFIQDIQGSSTAQMDQLFISATTVQEDSDTQVVQLSNNKVQVTSTTTQTTLNLDKELGKNVVFSLTGEIKEVELELTSPKGKRYLASSPEFVRTPSRLQYKIPTADTGKWIIDIRKKTSNNVNVDLSLVSEPKDPNVQPIKLSAGISAPEVDANKGLVVHAKLVKGNNVVIRANVQAEIVSDGGQRETITLKDDGTGADTIKDDGVYSSFFINFQRNAKRFAVVAKVTNRNEAFIKPIQGSHSILLKRTLRVTPKVPASNKFKIVENFQKLDEDPYAEDQLGEQTGEFDRIGDAGVFVVVKPRTEKDTIKPSTVNDLIVDETGETKDGHKFITLTWTSPGDDMDIGTPAKLEVRLSLNGNTFSKDFSTGFLVNSGHVLIGDLNPRAGGQKHTVTLRIPKELLDQTVPKKPFDVYVSVKATDKAGNVGDTGRTASGHFGYEIPICVQPSGMFTRARHCNQFYHCSNGVAYVKECPANLHFSVQTQRCEWPCDAKCDPKIKCSENK